MSNRRNAPPRWRIVQAALAALAVLAFCQQPAQSQSAAPPPVAAAPFIPVPDGAHPRLTVFISDLHFGLGRRPDGRWYPEEDFRWPKALQGFLSEIGRQGDDKVDLIIVGDFLELWQPPPHPDPKLKWCVGNGADAGCTLEEITKIVNAVVAAHGHDLALLRDFARRGDNRLHIIPGNHDFALLLPEIWKPVASALGAEAGRVALVTAGYWTSFDGRIVAEHGHQVGNDVNRYSAWPRVTREVAGTTYLERPWGERFVQEMFNAEENEYEIIDNIAPETVGAKYRSAERGLKRTVADFARFVAFNLLETSAKQKTDSLGAGGKAKDGAWDIRFAREELGIDLFIAALDDKDPLRKEIEGTDAESGALRDELAAIVVDPKRLSDDDVRALCDERAARKAERQCEAASAGALLEGTFVPRQHVLRSHIAQHQDKDDRVDIFVYGHTHGMEVGWPLVMKPGRTITVHNTGAFQRTIDEAGFKRRVAQRNLSDKEALRAIKLEELPACYSAVIVKYEAGVPNSKTWRWHMEESGSGSLVEHDDERCQ